MPNPTVQDICDLLGDLGAGVEDFKARHTDSTNQLRAEIKDIDSEVRKLAIQSAASLTAGGIELAGRASAVDRQAFAQYCRKGISAAAMGTDNDPSAGFTVGQTIDAEISYLARNANPLRAICKVVQAEGRYSKLVNLGTSAATWRGERSPVAETNGLSFAAVSPSEGELTALQYSTNWLLQDSSIDIENEILGDIALQFAESENVSFINGDGIDKPTGFLQAPQVTVANWKFGKLAYVKSGEAAGFVAASATVSPADCLIDLKNSLHAGYRANAHFVMNSATFSVVQKFKDPDGRYIVQTSLVPGAPDMLLGFPVVIDEAMPNIGENTTPIAFGDFARGYLIMDRVGTRVLRDPYSSKGNTVFFATKRVGGCVLDYKAIRLLKIAS